MKRPYKCFPLDSRLITRYYFGEKRVGGLGMPSAIVRFQIRSLIVISARFPFYADAQNKKETVNSAVIFSCVGMFIGYYIRVMDALLDTKSI
jgi:hypothetical protein